MKNRIVMFVLVMAAFLLAMSVGAPSTTLANAQEDAPPARGIVGPILGAAVYPTVYNGDLRDLPQSTTSRTAAETPLRPVPGKWPKAPIGWVDPVTQPPGGGGGGQIPGPLLSFEGLNIIDGGGWHPPDTNGDVGPNHYIQTVNIAIGIYNKTTGAPYVEVPYNTFFSLAPAPCDTQNRGDVIVLYDPLADRWVVTDFALPGAESWECIAVSQTGDPVGGGWYFYAINTLDGASWADYPKLSVWPDAYYMAGNMFEPWIGAKVWAFDRAKMLAGLPFTPVSFNAGAAYGSLLPSNLRGTPPPAGSPAYFMSFEFTNLLHIWKFHVDWVTPANSTFTGPVDLPVEPFYYPNSIPQKGVTQQLDTLGDRLMMQLQYRNFGTYEALYLNHTVPTHDVAGIRWYEVRDPGGSPFVYQQGTYWQPDGNFRWMGSLAVDQDGNLALGYSVASSSLYPAIRYTGRLAGEPLGQLLQGESSIIEGGGSQTGSSRWGDYSAMTVDPTDDCTFWYTTEYMPATGGNWSTRIGAFKFPSCGKPKGWIKGSALDANTLVGIPGVLVTAESPTTTMTAETNALGEYTFALPAGVYTLTAGPLLPGYPLATVDTDIAVTAGNYSFWDMTLVPFPALTEGQQSIDDHVAGANGNGYPEPGESGIKLWETITNTGATTATAVTAHLVSLTSGVTVTVADASYPAIPRSAAALNTTPFEFSLAPTIPCGTVLDFQKIIATAQGTYTLTFSLDAKVPLPRATFFSDNMESGSSHWVRGGSPNTWAITTETAHSPTHSWSDSPNSNYLDNTNNWIRGPILNLAGQNKIQLDFWHRYDMESGFDYGYVEYSLDGGVTWHAFGPGYSGTQTDWQAQTINAAALDNQASVSFRFRLETDGGVVADGWHIDDVALTYEPFACTFPIAAPGLPVQLTPPDGTVTAAHAVTLTWQAAAAGWAPSGYNLELDGQVITTTETFSATTLTSGLHTWRVRAFNQVGTSNYTSAWSVEVLDPPGVPGLVSPISGTITTTQTITLAWDPGVGGPADGYNLELDGQVITVTATTHSIELPLGEHTWRVRAFNAMGTSAYTDLWIFTIQSGEKLIFLPVILKQPAR